MKKLTRSPILQEIYHFLLEQQPTYGCPITSEVISQQLNLTPSYVREQMKWLIEERKIAVRRGRKEGTIL
ncbi:helix-turn-helix domain-containing protein [Effusibacillus dendaii]|uniref:LexA repressor DNA-binding domain-containing protein n=1 Tax=Effusibacillus dendaii TaxID=2743772 RepID=A0A7I8DF03_9BACL|nr:Rrf2 family transcriptional regulator [Effusibacillus dendaii]BCJ87872.1 hypothetical protein skT53_28570 [Effusibacillus dendaii]